MEIPRERQTEIYKTLTTLLSGMLITLIGAYLVSNHNVVTHEEFSGLVQQYSPYTSDQKGIREKLDTLSEQNVRLQTQVEQLQIDTARISEKLGVPAHPGVK